MIPDCLIDPVLLALSAPSLGPRELPVLDVPVPPAASHVDTSANGASRRPVPSVASEIDAGRSLSLQVTVCELKSTSVLTVSAGELPPGATLSGPDPDGSFADSGTKRRRVDDEAHEQAAPKRSRVTPGCTPAAEEGNTTTN